MAEKNPTYDFVLPSDLEEQRPIVERPDYKPAPRFRLPSDIPAPKPDYEAMPLSEAAWKGVKALPGNVMEVAAAIPQMVTHPSETWQGIKAIGKGALSSAAEKEISALESGAAGETGKKLAAEWRAKDQRTPEEKAAIQEPWGRFTAPYTSYAGFKEALATDPLSVTPLAGPPLRGLGAIVKGGDAASLARKVLAAPIKTAGYVADPIETSLSLAGAGAKKAVSGLKAGAAGFTDVPEPYVDIAYMTGKSRGPQADLAKQAFQTWFNKEGDVNEFALRSSKAFKAIEDENWKNWKAQKGGVMGQTGDVPFEPILKSLDERRSIYGPYDLATDEGKAAIDAINKVKLYINQRASLPVGDPARSVKGMDELKIQLGKEAEANPKYYAEYMAGYHGVKNAINDVAPEYQNLMDAHREMTKQMLTIQNAIKAKDTNTAIQSLTAFTKLLNTPEGVQIAKQISAKDPTILPSVAGAALNKDMPKLRGILDKTGIGAALVSFVTAIAMGYPEGAAIAGSAIPILSSVQTPKRLGQVAYTAGSIAGSPVGRGVSGATALTRPLASPATTFMENLRRTQEDLEKYPPEQADGGRVARATGGRIKNVQSEAEALMKAAESAKKGISKTTEALLDQPDEHIAKALEIAKQHI